MEKNKSFDHTARGVNWYSHYGELEMELSFELEILLLEYMLKINETRTSPSYVYCMIYNNQDTEINMSATDG